MTDLQKKILESAKQEFLRCGFKDASLRTIAANAQVTTGAIYSYFKDKNALFEGLVDQIYDQVSDMFSSLSKSYYNEETAVGEITFEKSLDNLIYIYQFIYKNYDEFRLLIMCAEGSSRSEFVHFVVDHEVEHTLLYLKRLRLRKEIDTNLIHMISESYINAIFEPLRHNLSYDQAIANADVLVTFYTCGWNSIIQKFS